MGSVEASDRYWIGKKPRPKRRTAPAAKPRLPAVRNQLPPSRQQSVKDVSEAAEARAAGELDAELDRRFALLDHGNPIIALTAILDDPEAGLWLKHQAARNIFMMVLRDKGVGAEVGKALGESLAALMAPSPTAVTDSDQP